MLAFRMKKRLDSSQILPKVDLLLIGAALVLAACGRQQPAAVKAKPPNPHSVTVSWTPSKSPAAGYNVYRVLPPGDPVKVSSGVVADTQFTDNTVEAGNTYLYFVTAVDSKGVESRPSERISVTIPTTAPPPSKQ